MLVMDSMARCGFYKFDNCSNVLVNFINISMVQCNVDGVKLNIVVDDEIITLNVSWLEKRMKHCL